MTDWFEKHMRQVAIEERKRELERDRKDAERFWELGDHEGNEHDKEYFIRGFISAANWYRQTD